jgi:hypothetical protein
MNLRPTNIEKGEGGEFSLFKLIGPIIMSLIVYMYHAAFIQEFITLYLSITYHMLLGQQSL